MSFIHYLFLGHFEHEGEIVRFIKGPNDAAYRPVVRSSLDVEAVKALLREVTGAEVDDLVFPEDWTMWLNDGYLVCEKYTRNREAISFVSRLVERTRCEIYDVSAHINITLGDCLKAMLGYAKAKVVANSGDAP
jgi:hypothetical protein